MKDLSQLLKVAVTAAHDAGRYAQEMSAVGFVVDNKTDAANLVTDVDRECERRIVEHLLADDPTANIIGEEGADRSGSSPVTWHIDPIDGTSNYVYGQPGYCVSIAASMGGVPTLGVVFDPSHSETFTAIAGQGAFRNNEAISVRKTNELLGAIVATGFAYDRSIRFHQGTVIRDLLAHIGNIRRFGAASLDLCWVGCGRLDAYYEIGLNSWDYMAGALIASEAGAIVDDLRNGPPTSTFTFASTPSIEPQLRQLLVDLNADIPLVSKKSAS